MRAEQNRILEERAFDGEHQRTRTAKSRRTVSVNTVESPLGWLFARGHLTQRQHDAGEQLRLDWERAQLSPRVTMRWDPAPVAKSRGGEAGGLQPAETQLKAKQRFDDALQAAGPGLTDILWRVVCAGEGMRDAETALGWPARAGKLVLTIALDRIADYYRLR
jgi:hypothetical protein